MTKVVTPKIDESIIQEVNFKIDTNEMLAYEFRTKEGIWNEEAECYSDLFRIEFHKDDNSIYIMVAWEDDFDVMEDLTYMFHENTILLYCKNYDLAIVDLEDLTSDYELHCDE